MTTSEFVLPTPNKSGERRAFLARHLDGHEQVWHATSRGTSWEVDVEDWWLFDRAWMTVDSADVTIPRRRTNPGAS